MPELNLPTLSNSRLKMISLTSGERDFSVQLEGFLSAPDIAAFIDFTSVVRVFRRILRIPRIPATHST